MSQFELFRRNKMNQLDNFLNEDYMKFKSVLKLCYAHVTGKFCKTKCIYNGVWRDLVLSKQELKL